MSDIQIPNVDFDQNKVETDLNYLIQQIYMYRFADQNSQLEVSLEPTIKVRRVVNGKIEEKTYNLKYFSQME